MKKIALYGYGVFGKRTSESFRFYWGGEYEVTAIFDMNQAGGEDSFWHLRIQTPEKIKEEYRKGVFEAVMVCIARREIRKSVCQMITDLGVPLFSPGSPNDFAAPEHFRMDNETGISVCRDGYSFHVFKNMLCAAGDGDKTQYIYLFDEQGKLYIENYIKYIHDYQSYLTDYPFRLKDPLPEKVFMEGAWCVIVKSYPGNYWHFTFETADCVYLLEKAGFKGKYICNEDVSSRDLLLIMGISPDRLLSAGELENHKVYVFERLFSINHVGLRPMKCSCDVLPELAEFIRGKLKRNEDSPKKLYVKRVGARKLLNGDEIAEKNGFTTIIPENYNLRDEIELFYNADIVICPHGANSTNHLYMRKGTVFMEIFSDRWYMDINSDICEANGVHYLELIGKACISGPKDRFADFTVDETVFQRMIDKAEHIIAAEKTKPCE